MITAILIVATVLIVGGYTAWRSWQGRGDLTVSVTLRRWSRSQLAVPFALASLAGHWFGPAVPAWWPGWTPHYLVGLTAVLGVVSVALCEADLIGEGEEGEEEPAWMWIVWLVVFVAGYVFGALLWPLEHLAS